MPEIYLAEPARKPSQVHPDGRLRSLLTLAIVILTERLVARNNHRVKDGSAIVNRLI